ncbi:MAG TPA: hypothetical protein VMH22_02380 [bacterium]|nr:hypothetical protein [bacterium]
MVEAAKYDQPVTALPAVTDVKQAKWLAWLSYLWILWLVPLFTMKNNAFAKFHVKQGIILTFYGIVLSVVGGAIALHYERWPLGWFMLYRIGSLIIVPVGFIILLILAIMGMINSVSGKYWKCPLGVGVLAGKWFKF